MFLVNAYRTDTGENPHPIGCYNKNEYSRDYRKKLLRLFWILCDTVEKIKQKFNYGFDKILQSLRHKRATFFEKRKSDHSQKNNRYPRVYKRVTDFKTSDMRYC